MQPQIHPLLLRECQAQYCLENNKNKIYMLESKLSIREMIGVAKVKIIKYEERVQDGLAILDEKKLQTWMDYKHLLEDLIYAYEYKDYVSVRAVIDERYPDMVYYFPDSPPLPGLEAQNGDHTWFNTRGTRS